MHSNTIIASSEGALSSNPARNRHPIYRASTFLSMLNSAMEQNKMTPIKLNHKELMITPQKNINLRIALHEKTIYL